MSLIYPGPRKRSASEASPYGPFDSVPEAPSGDQQKRTKTYDSELDAIDVIPVADAWPVDLSCILGSPTGESGRIPGHDNWGNYREGKSAFVFVVQGGCMVHYDLLCAILPELYNISPALQALVLCRDPSSHTPSVSVPFSLPLIQAVGPSWNHFVRLGLLHPLGGGQVPLDALVVVDAKGKRRLVLPFGWGAGRHVGDVGGGKMVQERLMGMLRKCIEELQREM
ncbi:hypothetical protein K432DRAFT_293163 [Lepidopterella palustris CBS 459.81]|uniref:Uncharacterized protein n=1 Tax=Lepidopterella palustris CBS 459.81 TaxID=1314670 RepID=A0A8E2JHS4_9PEZI|nr:hypothetical protein K432DRAFT_293163 [Lepidopterella palustris CBS 459.81]